ncbi:hypothetical protein [Moraxella sp. ZY200743]|uniref:hypothetical protein n=1 Tax=Moraxella sp. ZY200743 TaxID=2911970 RepID=UPI003D7EF67B
MKQKFSVDITDFLFSYIILFIVMSTLLIPVALIKIVFDTDVHLPYYPFFVFILSLVLSIKIK